MDDTKPLLDAAARRRPKGKAALRKEASYIFKYLLFAQVTVYLETGSIPCLLDNFAAVFGMNAREQGWLGSVVYIALCAASPLSAIAYKHIEAKYVLGISLVLNNLCVLGFALTPTGYENSSLILIVMRALIGFTQSFLCVYTPLWVDSFSPRGSVAGWMSYLQGSVPLGVMFGYLFGSVSNWLNMDMCYFQCWRWPFLLQFFLVVPLMVGVFFVPIEHLSIIKKKKTATIAIADKEETHPVVLEEMVLLRRKSMSNLSFSFWNESELNPAQFTAIRASYTTPRFRMDSYDIESLYLDEPMHDTMHLPLSNVMSSDSASTNSYGTLIRTPPKESYLEPSSQSSANMEPLSSTSSMGILPFPPDSQLSSGRTYRTARTNVDSPPLTTGIAAPNSTNPEELAVLTNSQWHPLKSTSPTHSAPPLPPLHNDKPAAAPSSVPQLFRSSRSSQRGLSSVLSSHYDDEEEEEDLFLDEDMGFFKSLVVLLKRPLFTLIVLGLSAIYFVVTGVQFWSTIYLQKNFDASVVIVNGLFVLVAGTGPIWGVFFGGALIDRAGGYMGLKQRAKALGICCMLGFVAFALGVITTFLPNLYLVAGSLWLLLFFGGSILPSCTGIFISATPVQLRSLASSVSVMVFNLLGYALAPVLTGSFMELIHKNHEDPTSYWYNCDEACMYRVGFRCCLAWSVWSLLSMLAAYGYAQQQAANASVEQSAVGSPREKKSKIAIMMH